MLITLEELARGACIGVFGGLAGACTLAWPGSPLWIAPAALAVGGCVLTIPEVRAEVRAALPEARRALAALPLPGRERAGAEASAPLAQGEERAEAPGGAPAGDVRAALAAEPHRLIIGGTRGGKTTLIHDLATRWAAEGARVLVCDPDAAPGMWPGCRAAGHGDDLAAIEALLHEARAEIAARRAQRAQGRREFPPLHLVIDEAQDVLPVVPGALDLFEDVARRGAKLNVRLTAGVQDKQVKTLGLEGKSALLANFAVAEARRGADGRRVVITRDPLTGERRAWPAPDLPSPETFISAPAPAPAQPRAAPAAPAPASADELLAALLAEGVTSASGRGDNAQGVTVTVTNAPGNGNGNGEALPAHQDAPSGVTGPVTVNVTAHAVAPAPARRARRGRGGVDARRLRALAQARRAGDLAERYRAAARAGETFRQAYARLGGNRNEMFAAWKEGKR